MLLYIKDYCEKKNNYQENANKTLVILKKK
jgi:hypothetical protein